MKKFLLGFSLLVPAIAFAQSYTIDWYKIAGGGGVSTGSVYSVSGTIGQPEAGTMGGGNYLLTGGFWALQAVQTPGSPMLVIAKSGTNALLSWPANAGGFTLQHNINVALTNGWTAVTATPVVQDGFSLVALPLSPGSHFYRLRHE